MAAKTRQCSFCKGNTGSAISADEKRAMVFLKGKMKDTHNRHALSFLCQPSVMPGATLNGRA